MHYYNFARIFNYADMKKEILIFLLAVLLLQSCEFIPFKEYNHPAYDGDFEWTLVVDNAEWSNRLDHAALAYDNKLWVIGGYNPGERKNDSYLEDVWSSDDGLLWELVTDKAPWKGRRGHTVTVFDDGTGEAMFLVGGFTVDEATGYREYNNDVWRSVDGENWMQVKIRTYPLSDDLPYIHDWFPRMNHTTITATHGGIDYMYIIGGSTMRENTASRYSMVYFNDVWRSTNGIDWDSLSISDDIGIRAQHAATVDKSTQRIYIQGGMHGVIFEGENYGSYPTTNWRDLWSSDDGINWIHENGTSVVGFAYMERAEHALVHMGGNLYGLPGKSISNVHFHFAKTSNYRIWKRDDGLSWNIDSEGIDFDARYAYATVVFDNKVWILGGDTDQHGPSNDVWYGELK